MARTRPRMVWATLSQANADGLKAELERRGLADVRGAEAVVINEALALLFRQHAPTAPTARPAPAIQASDEDDEFGFAE